MKQLIFCKFLDAEGNPRGRDYTYYADFEVNEGDKVIAEVARGSHGAERKTVTVTKTGLKPEEIPGFERFQSSVKTVSPLPPKGEAQEISLDEL